MQRVSVVGISGAGKTHLAARLADALGVPLVELDAIHHLPGWEPIDPGRFQETVRELCSGDAWVVDGNYRAVVVDGPVWERADTVVWLDLPRRTVMRQVVLRSMRRVLTRQELWNQNRERVRDLLSWDPAKSIIRWSWTQYPKYQQRYGSAMTAPEFDHISFVRLRSHREADQLLTRGRTLSDVAGHVINGDRWIAQRLAYLRALLESDLAEHDRMAVENEIALLSKERGMIAGGLRVPRLLRRFRRTD